LLASDLGEPPPHPHDVLRLTRSFGVSLADFLEAVDACRIVRSKSDATLLAPLSLGEFGVLVASVPGYG
jgi:hypothetical protein